MNFKNKKIIQYVLFLLFQLFTISGNASFFIDENEDSLIFKRSREGRYADNSVLATGKWMKISVEEAGIHKIPYSKLTEWGFSKPAEVRVFGYGGEMLPAANNVSRPDDLPEVAIWHHNSAIYFYAQDLVVWRWNNAQLQFSHDYHRYSTSAFYFLTDLQGDIKTITQQPQETQEHNVTVTHFDDLRYHEIDIRKIANTGRIYFGEEFSNGVTMPLSFNFPSRDTSQPVKIAMQVAGKGSIDNYFNVRLKNQTSVILSLKCSEIKPSSTGTFGSLSTGRATFEASTNNIDLELSYTGAGCTGYLDYIALNARSFLRLNHSQLIFRDKTSNASGKIALFKLQNVTAETVVWDITDRNNAQRVPFSRNGNNLEFKTQTSQLKEFAVFNPSGTFPLPKKVEDIENQNLHKIEKIDYIIVAHKDFHPYAQELADLHFQYSGLETIIVTPEQIYNEFSYGHQDPTAIRSFAKMIYDRNQNGGIKYLALLGDGSHDNKGILPNHNTKYEIVTWQTENSMTESSSYVCDDYFGILKDYEGNNLASDRLDIAIGRFPINSVAEAATCIAKIRKYIEEQTNGSWRKQITFLVDDGGTNFEEYHFTQAQKYSTFLEKNYPQFYVNKIYLDSYPRITTSSGKSFPAASEAANRTINEGTLIFNYIGHGSPRSIAHEKIITSNHVKTWTNLKTLAFFVTATCELSRFDDHTFLSLGEEIFLYPHGGAISMFTTTREVGASSNGNLNEALHNFFFMENEKGEKPAIGDVVMKAKNSLSSTETNRLKWVFFGCPALKLAYPNEKMNIDSVINHRTNNLTDRIKALSHTKLKGNVIEKSGEIMDDFNGIAEVVVYDKPLLTSTLGNDDNKKLEYSQYANIIFTGRSSVKNGEFSFEFITPKDIRFNEDYGKISVYAYSTTEGDRRQAAGARTDILMGGFEENNYPDNQGPQITLYLNNESFKDGGKTGSTPLLFAKIEDESGINVGNGIGHDIILTIDGDNDKSIVLNKYFHGEIDNFKAGMVIYQLPKLEAGKHELTLKAWDTYNNSSIAKLNFVVGTDNELKIMNFVLHPVPIQTFGTLNFSFETDEPNSTLSVAIDGINMSGGITGKTNKEMVSYGSFIEETQLPLTSLGIRNPGLYLIRFVITTKSGKKGQIVQKIMVSP